MRDVGEGILPPLFAGRTPQLERFVLAGFTSWSGNKFVNLKELCLCNQVLHARPHMSSLLGLLEASPHLQDVVPACAGPDTLDDPQGHSNTSPRLVALPDLRVLEIGNWTSASVIASFLSRLVVLLTQLHIWGYKVLSGDETFVALLPEDLTQLGPLQRLTTFCLTADASPTFEQFLTVRDGVLYVTGQFYAPDTLLPLFVQLDTRHVRALMLATYGEPDWSRERWKAVLSAPL
ncbi:hypothetical protein SCP_0200700 [Sparassis crispa]|uniref:F-box domain-containing protein n=1 Tax=Sparassis crispa TaxID=139825 RepID=A0A401G9R7_9APHY|nr:hypothetical protein SCP_0200700 [Sparassis crispa]GBE78873.1 hypothetical protein SCP_0200700 [Sparassis crispa]